MKLLFSLLFLISTICYSVPPIQIIQDFTVTGAVGVDAGQKFAGHTLEAADFTATPEGQWIQDDLTDDSGNSNTLTNQGTTLFGGVDIYGVANAANFISFNLTIKLVCLGLR